MRNFIKKIDFETKKTLRLLFGTVNPIFIIDEEVYNIAFINKQFGRVKEIDTYSYDEVIYLVKFGCEECWCFEYQLAPWSFHRRKT